MNGSDESTRQVPRRAIAVRRAALCLSLVAGAAVAGNQPALNGWWVNQLGASNVAELQAENRIETFQVPPLKAEYLEPFRAGLEMIRNGVDTNAVRGLGNIYCGPYRFVGTGLLTTDPNAAVEFLTTPGRITIADEANHLRRIFLGNANVDDDFESYVGMSRGRWEGQTLVIETTGLNPNNRWALDASGVASFRIGSDAKITERITLKRQDVLQVTTTLTAPEALTVPLQLTMLYQREKDHVFRQTSDCADYDRQIDPKTGAQRYDLTPPADLPPPPAE